MGRKINRVVYPNGIVYYKKIKDFIPYVDENYFITSDGEVFDGNRSMIKDYYEDYGTLRIKISICNGEMIKSFAIHRLVALAFVPNDRPIVKNYVKHLDDCKTNNNANNLVWREGGTQINEKQAIYICKFLEKSINYIEIFKMLHELKYGIPDIIIDIIRSIHMHKYYTYISSQYNF